MLPMQGEQVQSLVGKLRFFHAMQCGQKKKKKKKKQKTNNTMKWEHRYAHHKDEKTVSYEV